MSSKKGTDDNIMVYLRLKPTKKESGFLTIDDVDPSVVRLNIPERGVSRADG